MKTKRYLLSALFVLFSLIVYGESGEVLTLSGLIKNFKNNLMVKQNMYNLQAAAAEYRDSLSSLYPSVSVSIPTNLTDNTKSTGSLLGTDYTIKNSISWSVLPEFSLSQYLPSGGTLNLSMKNELMGSANGTIEPETLESQLGGTEMKYQNTPSVRVSLTQPLFFGDAYGASRRMAENVYGIAEKQFIARNNELIIELINEYYNLKYLKYSMVLIESRLSDARVKYKSMSKLFSLGKLTRLELLKAEATLKKAEIDLANASRNYQEKRKEFLKKYGLDSNTLINTELEDIFDYSTFESLERVRDAITARAITANINLAIDKYNLKITRDRLVQLKASYAPLLTVFGNISFLSTSEPDKNLSIALGNSFNDKANPVIAAGVNVSATLYDAGSVREKVEKLEYQIKVAESQIERDTMQILSGVNDLLNSLKKGIELEEYWNLNVEIAELEYEKAEKDFNLGRITQNDLNTLRMEKENANLSLLSNKIEINLNYLKLLNIQGENLIRIMGK